MGVLIAGGIILGIIAGILTRSIVIGIVFTILVGGFGVMWRYIRNNERRDNMNTEQDKQPALGRDIQSGYRNMMSQQTPEVQNQPDNEPSKEV